MPEPSNSEGLYVHVPFCDGKCHYCAFYSVPYHRALGEAWLSALRAELDLARAEYGPSCFSTLFMGGGTPTILPDDQLRTLLGFLKESSGVADGAGIEWTSEANPGSLTAAKLAIMKSCGVNRISLGVQAMDDSVLRQLGRRHTVRDVTGAVAAIRGAGITTWGLDLIACVPGVTVEAWRTTLQSAVAFEPSHVSVYALTSEEGTQLARDRQAGVVELLDDGEQLRMVDVAEEVLDSAGLARYEISNYAKPGFECRHNCSCWRGRDYLGVGCAASSRVGNRRWTNASDLNGYLKSMSGGGHPPREVETLSPLTDAVERMVFGLRMAEGIDLGAILAATGLTRSAQGDVWRETLIRLAGEGLLTFCGGRCCLTARGRALADHVAVELMP